MSLTWTKKEVTLSKDNEIHRIKIDKGRESPDSDSFVAAIDILRGAKSLAGCPNRLNLLTATANLEWARHARAGGADPRPQLEVVIRLCDHEGANVTDNEPWEAIRVEAEREMAKL